MYSPRELAEYAAFKGAVAALRTLPLPLAQSAGARLAGALFDLGGKRIDYVLANAGTDFAPVIEGLVRAAGRKDAVPRFITVPHENLAMAMAHGYYQVAGKPAGVMVHVTVGTGNTICALMNANRDNVPLLLMAGRTPLTQDGHIASRSAPIHWGQGNFDQAGIVREYTKWDFELRAGQPVEEVVSRALGESVDADVADPRVIEQVEDPGTIGPTDIAQHRFDGDFGPREGHVARPGPPLTAKGQL